MMTNKLKLNDNKTEVVLLGTRQQLEKLESNGEFKVKTGSEIIKPVSSARNLGYFMESQLKSKTHITKVCGTSYSTLKNIARIHSLLTPETAKIIVQGLVINKLDYCNALLLGTSGHQLSRLQMTQNMGCRVISSLKKHDHVSNAMKELHWLKVQEWIQYKVLVTMYQCVNGLAPSFLTNLLDMTRKHLRSDTQGKLPIPHCSLSQVCNSSIRYAGPRLWNELPQHLWSANSLGTFKSLLKTHLFKKSYDC